MDEAAQTRMALAALFAALVEALDEKSDGLAHSFSRHLGEAQAKLRENDAENRAVLETLARTKAFLREDLDRSEPAYVVYPKRLAGTEDMLPSTDKIALPTLDEAIRFWTSLPSFDRENASVETASGHRFAADAIPALAKRFKDRPIV